MAMASSSSTTWSLEILQPHERRHWSNVTSSSHQYFLDHLTKESEVALLHRQLQCLENGTTVACRGRDFVDQNWDYGYCTKQGSWLYFEYASGDRESFFIHRVDWARLVHLALGKTERNTISASITLMTTENKSPIIVLLAHGWSPHVGPNYPLIRKLEARARARGCCHQVLVPDFRPTYAYDGSHRSRSERVRMVYEELLVALGSHCRSAGSHQPPRWILVGHSQGGAAVACACTRRLCTALDIRGALLLGTEDPTAHDRMDWRPAVPKLEIVHAQKDATIEIGPIRRLGSQWRCDFTTLDCPHTPPGAVTSDGDDIHHDFLSPDLMAGVMERFDAFLETCLHDPY